MNVTDIVILGGRADAHGRVLGHSRVTARLKDISSAIDLGAHAR